MISGTGKSPKVQTKNYAVVFQNVEGKDVTGQTFEDHTEYSVRELAKSYIMTIDTLVSADIYIEEEGGFLQ